VLDGRQPGAEGNVGIRYQATTGEDTADGENMVRAVLNCRVRELAIEPWLRFLTPINPLTNPNPVASHCIR
jgi:hypothetical protein